MCGSDTRAAAPAAAPFRNPRRPTEPFLTLAILISFMPHRYAAAHGRQDHRLENYPESQLHHAWLIRQTRVLNRLSIARIAFRKRVGAVVGVVEEVEHLHQAVHGPVATQPEATLEPDVHPVQRQSHEVVARHDAAIWTQAGTIPATISGCVALARAVKIQPAQLEAE